LNPKLSTIICAYNSDPSSLQRTLEGIQNQNCAGVNLEILLIDNASTPPLKIPLLNNSKFPLRQIKEAKPGLSQARRRGFMEATGDFFVLVDDDTILHPDYLEKAFYAMTTQPHLGCTGGKSIPEFEVPPDPWMAEFFNLLALRDLGEQPLRAGWNQEYPLSSPVGAGMVLRREVAETWLKTGTSAITDRKGAELSSGGDNDIVLCALKAGWQVGYDPTLVLTHLIPASRLEPNYLERLNHGIQKSWMQVLSFHGINPWPPIPKWSVAPRKLKAWFTRKAWTSPAARIRWRGACGHFEGRVEHS